MKQLFIFLLLLFTSQSYSQEDLVAPALEAFKNGKYKQAYFLLKGIKSENEEVLLKKTYFEALCLNRLKRFDLSIKKFQYIEKKNYTPKEFFYENGQANYALNNLEEARTSFSKSVQVGFQKSPSLYLMGYISQILEDFSSAEKNYRLLLKEPTTKRSMRQVAVFQLTQVLIARLQNVKDKTKVVKYIKKTIIPQLNFALNINKRSSVAKDIIKKKEELEIEYGLNPLFLVNGKKLPPIPYTINLSQSFKYDSNITSSTDSTENLNSMKDTSILGTTIIANYTKPFKRMFTVQPGITLSLTTHGRSYYSDVVKSNALSITTALNNTYEHKLFGNQASFLFNFDHSYSGTDSNSTGELSKITTSSNGYTFTVGEKFKYFKFGDTTVNFKFKISKSSDDTQHNKVYTFSLNQIALLPTQHMLIFTHQTDLTRYDTATTSDTNTFLARFDYMIPEIIPSYTLSFGFAGTFAPTLYESTTPERGMEITWNPSAKITKKTTKNLSTTVSYSYTKKTSGNPASYAYTKQVTSIDLAYSF